MDAARLSFLPVMAALEAAIQEPLSQPFACLALDGRVKPGHGVRGEAKSDVPLEKIRVEAGRGPRGAMIAVIGCGNANRTDDAAGLEVVRLLNDRGTLRSCADVRLLDAGTDGMAVMFAARGCTTLLVVDSARTGAEPGAIFEVPGHEVESRFTPSLNLHDFRWDHALYAGRQIYREAFPNDVTAFLIEARSLALGCGLSPDVSRAVATVVQRIEARIAATLDLLQRAEPQP